MSPDPGKRAPVRGPDEIDSKVLLEQGDELLKSSRALLDDLEAVVPSDDAPDIDLTES